MWMDDKLAKLHRRYQAELNEGAILQPKTQIEWEPWWKKRERMQRLRYINSVKYDEPIKLSSDPAIRFGWKKPVKKAIVPVVKGNNEVSLGIMNEKKRKEKGDEAVATLALEGRGPCGKPKAQCKCNDVDPIKLVQTRWPSTKRTNVPGKHIVKAPGKRKKVYWEFTPEGRKDVIVWK